MHMWTCATQTYEPISQEDLHDFHQANKFEYCNLLCQFYHAQFPNLAFLTKALLQPIFLQQKSLLKKELS